ncbi:MAG: transposase [Hyphomicrobiaceae bacterium]|jgi:transposase
MQDVVMSAARRPETEVTEKATRRRFSAEYKRKIVHEATGCTKSGELGALLRREGLFSSQLSTWRRQVEQGELAGLTARKRGPKAAPVDPRDKKIAELERINAKLSARAERAEAIVEIQKKVAKLLGIAMANDEGES